MTDCMQGNTALYYAAALDHVEIVSTLICHGADTNAVNYQVQLQYPSLLFQCLFAAQHAAA